MLAPSDRAVFRMGIHAGDILEEDGDIFGDGVNIASRLEGIAAPGTVAISSKVHEEVDRRLGLEFRELGFKVLKNIEKPIRVYQLEAAETNEPPAPFPGLPEKPSIAILPMLSFGTDRDDEFLADGLTEDLTIVLFGVPWLFVIARNSAFTYKGLSADILRIGAEPGVRYIVEGSLRRSGDRVRISVQLASATDGRQIWADRYESEPEDIFDLQDRIVGEIVQVIAPQIQAVEIQKSTRKRPDDLTSHDVYLNALGALDSARITEAERLLEKAIEVSPDYASAKAVLAWCTTLRVAWQWSEEAEALKEKGVRLCQEAINSPQCDVETQAYAGYTMAFHLHDVDRGTVLLADAVRQCPSFAWPWASRSYIETFFGDPRLGVEFAEKALRLNPRDPLVLRIHLALTNAYYGLREYSNALFWAQKGLRRNSNIVGFQILKVLSLSMLGRAEEARDEASALIGWHPNFRVSRFMFHTGKFAHLTDAADALRASGLPD